MDWVRLDNQLHIMIYEQYKKKKVIIGGIHRGMDPPSLPLYIYKGTL